MKVGGFENMTRKIRIKNNSEQIKSKTFHDSWFQEDKE